MPPNLMYPAPEKSVKMRITQRKLMLDTSTGYHTAWGSFASPAVDCRQNLHVFTTLQLTILGYSLARLGREPTMI